MPQTQIKAPKKLKSVKRRLSISATPATNGAKVRMNGRKRANTMVMLP